MVDLGRHRLKGLERPERIVRLDAPALPVVDAPTACRPRTRRQPAAPVDHVDRPPGRAEPTGRHGRHAQVGDRHRNGRGRQDRLALAAADAVADQFPDGTWFVELGELHDAADVPSAVATTLALQPAPAARTSPRRSLRWRISTPCCCSTTASTSSTASSSSSPRSSHTASGSPSWRRAARHSGSATRSVSTCVPSTSNGDGGTSDAMRLFCERAAAVLGSFQPSDADVAVIDEICRRLDGLPLAIELATARLSAMTVAELRAHLDDRLEVLTRRRGVNARHQSLRATVAWSYDLLTDVEQSFFDELSVFGADFGAGAARAVGGDTTVPVEDLLMSLVDKSLLTADRGPLGTRFRQLETRAPIRRGPPPGTRRDAGEHASAARPLRRVDGVRRRGHQGSRRAALAPRVHRRVAQHAQRVPVGLHGRRRRRRVPPGQRNAVVGDVADATRGRTVVRAGTRGPVGGRPPAEAGRVGGRGPLRSHARRSRP